MDPASCHKSLLWSTSLYTFTYHRRIHFNALSLCLISQVVSSLQVLSSKLCQHF